MRRIRYVPPGGALLEVTCRTLQGRFLLRPSQDLRDLVVGILARAQRLYQVKICAYVVLANHVHLLLDVPDAEQAALFMNYFNGNLAREAGRLVEWREKFWGRRYEGIVVSDEEAAQVARLRYLLSNGVKENLVARPQDWKGPSSARALVTGETLRGWWFDRSREYAAERRGKPFGKYDFAEREILELSPLPCWKHLSAEEYRRRVAELVRGIEEEGAAERRRTGATLSPPEKFCRIDPHSRPEEFEPTPAPLVHAATRQARKAFKEAYRLFVEAFREASARLRSGDGDETVAFPEGSFPPGLPFVKSTAALDGG